MLAWIPPPELLNRSTLDKFDHLLQGDLGPTYVKFVKTEGKRLNSSRTAAKSSRGKRGKKKRRLTGDKLLCLSEEWLTVYVQEHNPMLDWISTAGATVVVPEMSTFHITRSEALFRDITVHLINRNDAVMLNELCSTSFNHKLREISLSSKEMKMIGHSRCPLRFSIVKADKFRNLPGDIKGLNEETNCGVKFYWHYSKLPNEATPGSVVSMWKCDETIRNLFPRRHFSEVQDRFGRAFGDRFSVPCGGMNCYTGPINSDRASLNPVFGKEKRSKAEYDRSYYSYPNLHRTVVSRIRSATRTVLNRVRSLNGYYMSFVGYGTSSRCIWTQGVSRRSSLDLGSDGSIIKRDNVKTAPHGGIGFYNKPHFDKGDVSPEEVVSEWMEEYESAGKDVAKLKEVHETIGIGLPTTCGYNFSVPNHKHDISAYFLLWGFLTCLTDCSLHHFCAWCIPHCTSLPTCVIGNKVRCNNSGLEEGACMFVCAFGISGGRKDALLRKTSKISE